MDLSDIIAKVNGMDAALRELKANVVSLASGAPPVVSMPPIVVMNPMYEMDANHFLTHVRAHGGGRVDPVVGPDCPYTVTLPKTGHTLSVARPDIGEMFIGYVQRTADQATGGKGDTILGTVGSLFLGTAWLFEPFGGFKTDGSNWPQAADRFCNIRAYMTPEEIARDEKNKADWAAVGEVMKNQPPIQPTPPPEETPL